MNNIKERIQKLRKMMQQQQLDAYYISGTDPHSSEYLPDYWQTRTFISGFTGSYGMVVVTKDKVGLWTDSRYFIQAKEQLQNTSIEMFKLRTSDAISPAEWLLNELNEHAKVGVNAETIAISDFQSFKTQLSVKAIDFVATNDLLNEIWNKRPTLPQNTIFALPAEIAGSSRAEKRNRIVSSLVKNNCEIQILTKLDDIAWTYNLRGSDIKYNPVFLSFALISLTESILFVDEEKLSFELKQQLKTDNIKIRSYQHFYEYVSQIKDKKIAIDFSSANYAIFNALQHSNNTVKNIASVATALKMIKNETEIEGFKTAMQKDGVALIKFLHWIKSNISTQLLTEYDVVEKLAEFRAQNNHFYGESFSTISGYRAHGAIVHLSVNKNNALPLETNGILLFDSGGQYLEGTTDITRTIALGAATPQQKTDYTLVLKGMINLSRAKFPENTKGCQLDTLARQALWQHGCDYGHGTGHGVGHFLNVHEAPVSIRKEDNGQILQSGMVLSNEPGIYREGEYGIRIENLILCTKAPSTDFGDFLQFETLTLCPIDTTLIDKSLLSAEEISWINDYHKMVREKLINHLNNELKDFLIELTEVI